MKYMSVFAVFMCAFFSVSAQVGIGTTTPDASSQLDVTATNKGILLPRISLNNVADTVLDGTNTAATGLLIYNTNSSTVGGSGVGYYYFNGTTWERLTTSATTTGDIDWYEVGTTTSPNAITDNIFTQGNVAIGKTTTAYALDIEETTENRGINVVVSGADNNAKYAQVNQVTNTGFGAHYGAYNVLGGIANGSQFGSFQEISNTGLGNNYGSYNLLSGTGASNQYGSFQNIESTGTGPHYGSYNLLSGTGHGIQYGTQNTLNGTGWGIHYGSYNVMSGTGTGVQYGTNQQITNTGIGNHYGSYNDLSGTGGGHQFGTRQGINNSGNGDHYGSYNWLSGTGTGPKYGLYSLIDTSAGGTHYGVYSTVLKSGSYAGYFLGNVAIGTTTANNYILPASRGTATQVMQTDGSGNVTWVDATTLPSFWSRTGTALDVATTGDDITFGSQLTSITFPAASGTPPPMIQMFASGTNNANRMVLAHSPTYTNYGLEYDDSSDIFRFLGNGSPIVEIDLAGGFPLRVYGTARAVSFQSNTTTYPDYVFEKYYHKFSDINSAYTFKPLSEVESFIKKNGYLPNVQSYDEVVKHGMTINLAETSVTNLEKIEELFLYAIEEDKKITTLTKENNLLRQQLQHQQTEIDAIKEMLIKQ